MWRTARGRRRGWVDAMNSTAHRARREAESTEVRIGRSTRCAPPGGGVRNIPASGAVVRCLGCTGAAADDAVSCRQLEVAGQMLV